MKIGSGNLGEFLAALAASRKETQYGDPLPLNEGAIAAQAAHCDRVDPLIDALTKAERALRDVREGIEDEQRRWHREMIKAMPELAQGDGFKVSDDQKHYMRELDESDKPQPPGWVTEVMKTVEGGSGTVQ